MTTITQELIDMPKIRGKVSTDQRQLERLGSDLSQYFIIPEMAVTPIDEEDVIEILRFAQRKEVSVTPRGAGSNLSGSAIGEGMVLLMREMDRFVSRRGDIYSCQPGMVFNSFDKIARADGMFVPYDPSSRAFCSIGGNVGTRASGIRSLKYGSVDKSLFSLRFASIGMGLVDTEKDLPSGLSSRLEDIRERLLGDEAMLLRMEARGDLKSSSGYNLGAFLEHSRPNDIAAHLMVGSVGTLGVITEVRLRLRPAPKSRLLYLIFFDSIVEAVRTMLPARAFGPSAFELLDRFGVNNLATVVDVPHGSKAVIMLEFDDDLKEAEAMMAGLLKGRSSQTRTFKEGDKMEKVWSVREGNLLRIKHDLETPEIKFLSFIDDLAVPPDVLPEVIGKIERIFADEDVKVIIYGHVGEGNLHIRPYMEKEGWQERAKRLADRCFNVVLESGGTITGEHGMGRNRSKYLCDEWGSKACDYFKEIKDMFDPDGLMNPEVVFTEKDLTEGLRF